jgi:hypothetical protein
MRGRVSALLAPVVALGAAFLTFGQACKAQDGYLQKSSLQVSPQPYTFQYKSALSVVDSTGTETGKGETREVISGDSKGRESWASFESETGVGRFTAFDHAGATRSVWKTDSEEARVLKLPAGLPGQESWWRIPQGEPDFPWGGGPLFLPQLTVCSAAEKHYCSGFGEVYSARAPKWPLGSSVAKASYADCQSSFQKIPGLTIETKEDMGITMILGLEAHGCRETAKNSTDKTINEQWIVLLGLEGARKPLALREKNWRSPLSGVETSQWSREMTSLSFDEPAPAAFHPPANYRVLTFYMHLIGDVPPGSPQR